MDEATHHEITRILEEDSPEHRPATLERLMPLVIDRAKAISAAWLRAERVDHTLQATDLAHEGFIRLTSAKKLGTNRDEFFALFGTLVRHVLVDHARQHASRQRKHEKKVELLKIPLQSDAGLTEQLDLIALDDALQRLDQIGDPHGWRKLVELRFFAGLTITQIATELEVVEKTVSNRLQKALTYLRVEIEGSS